ncbi:MAG: exo-alpha-sialidase [Bacteroidota bacterium]
METITIFSPGEDDPHYNHGAVLYPFQGILYAMWQCSASDEDAPDTHVLYSRSTDGLVWEKAHELTACVKGEISTSGGWWSDSSGLIAFINVWPDNHYGIREGYTAFIRSCDGLSWSPRNVVRDIKGDTVPGIIEQDLHALPGGRILTAFHLQPGLTVTPCYTDDPYGLSGWVRGNMEHLPYEGKGTSRELEPSWFLRSDGAPVMLFRDQAGTCKKLASLSVDSGATWTRPVLTMVPDSRSKQCAGNLPDGSAYMVYYPSGTTDRFPMALALSRDGFLFDRCFLLRSSEELEPMSYPGKYKRPGYSYPKSVVWGSWLYIVYATNKEEIQLTRIPLKSLE